MNTAWMERRTMHTHIHKLLRTFKGDNSSPGMFYEVGETGELDCNLRITNNII